MKIQKLKGQGFAIISLDGDLIGEEVGPDLLDAVNNLILDGFSNCIIDISGIRFINSSGIGVLITILTKLRNKDGDLVLVNPSEHVKKLLIITKLNAIFKITDSIEAAKAQL